MTKTELISAISDESGLTANKSEKALKAFIDVVTSTLGKGESVQLIGFGTFGVAERAEHGGINPKTKEKIKIPAKKVPTFKAGKSFKEAVN